MSTDPFEIVANYTYDWETWFLPDGRVRWINPGVERMTGFTVEECLVMEDYPLAIVHDQDRPEVRNLLDSALAGTSGNDVEFRISRKDGHIGWAAVSWQPMIGACGELLGVRTSVRDISWRKSAEESLRLAKADAERANKAKSRFLAAASHDLRQPLQAISMYVAALRRRPLDRDSQVIISDIRQCLAAGSELLEDLVDISRLDAGVVVPEFTDVALIDLFEILEASFQRKAQARKLDLRFIPRSIFVHADSHILSRILQNLVSNALNHTREGGRVLVGCRERHGTAVLEVWDTGIGIAPDQHSLIFEEFYQVDNRERYRQRGAGLGLAIVRRQAELLGTVVSVRSELGKGSVFSIALPLANGEDHVALTTIMDDKLEFKDRTIAIIDDEPLQLHAMRTFLGLCQARVIEAQSIDELLTKLESTELAPELIIADYRLQSDMTGFDAIAAVRFKLGHSIPGILVTGDTEPKRIAEAELSGCRLLHKPLDPTNLAQTIGQMLDEFSTVPH